MRRKNGKDKEKATAAGGSEVIGSHEISIRFDRMADGRLRIGVYGLSDVELARDISTSVVQAIRRHSGTDCNGAEGMPLLHPGEC